MQVVAVVVLQIGSGECHGYPQLRVFREGKSSRHYSNNAVRLIVHADIAADYVRVGTKPLLPDRCTDDDDFLRSCLIFFWKEIATQRGSNAKHRKQTGGDARAIELFGCAVA